MQEPTFKSLKEEEAIFGAGSDTDYKIRKTGHSIPVFVLAPFKIPKEIDPKLAAFLSDEIRLILAKVKGKQVRIADSGGGSRDLDEFMETVKNWKSYNFV